MKPSPPHRDFPCSHHQHSLERQRPLRAHFTNATYFAGNRLRGQRLAGAGHRDRHSRLVQRSASSPALAATTSLEIGSPDVLEIWLGCRLPDSAARASPHQTEPSVRKLIQPQAHSATSVARAYVDAVSCKPVLSPIRPGMPSSTAA